MNNFEVLGNPDQLTLLEVAALPATITTEQAAKVCGLTSRHVQKMCERGMFGAFKSSSGRNGSWRISTMSFLRNLGLLDDVRDIRETFGIEPGQLGNVGRVWNLPHKNLALVRDVAPTSESQEKIKGLLKENAQLKELVEALSKTGIPASKTKTKKLTEATEAEINAMPELIDVKQAASIGAVSVRSIHRYVAQNKLECLRQGHNVLYRKDDVVKFFNSAKEVA